jgi:hypothetical protein
MIGQFKHEVAPMKTLANVIDIEPATRSISTLPGNVCLRCSDGLLIAYEVARQFESHLLHHPVRRELGSAGSTRFRGGGRENAGQGEPKDESDSDRQRRAPAGIADARAA